VKNWLFEGFLSKNMKTSFDSVLHISIIRLDARMVF